MKKYCTIEKLHFPVDEYIYNVLLWKSIDGGKTFFHCGYGKMAKTKQEAEQIKKEMEA